MKQVLLFLLLLPLLSAAQRTDWDIAFMKSIPEGLGKPIHMPDRDYNPHFRFEDTVDYRQKSKVYIITTDPVYRKMFWRYIYTKDSLKKYEKDGNLSKWDHMWMRSHLIDSLPAIDFSVHELVMYAACAQCFAYCNHLEGEDHCHRNACNFRETWFIREKKKKADH